MNNQTEKLLLVFCNFPDVSIAQEVAKQIISNKLAACVNIFPEIISIYQWEGQLEQTREVHMQIKTTFDAYSQLEVYLRLHHPYSVPEIIACPISAGLPDYLNWVRASVSSCDETQKHDDQSE